MPTELKDTLKQPGRANGIDFWDSWIVTLISFMLFGLLPAVVVLYVAGWILRGCP